MAKSIKLKNDTYLDSSSVVYDKQLLSNILTPQNLTNKINFKNGTLNSNHNYLYKFGSLIVFNLTVKIATAIPANTSVEIYTFPSEAIPIGNLLVSGMSYPNVVLTGSYMQAKTGNIIVRSPSKLAVDSEVNLWGVYYLT